MLEPRQGLTVQLWCRFVLESVDLSLLGGLLPKVQGLPCQFANWVGSKVRWEDGKWEGVGSGRNGRNGKWEEWEV